MRIRWYGQSAFTLTGDEHTVTIDPFGVPRLGLPVRFAYPAIAEHPADLLLISHEHLDHNGAEVVTGSPEVVRATAGCPTGLGEVAAIASQHDDAAGTQRGPNTIFVFELDGRRVCHFGDFGQPALRPGGDRRRRPAHAPRRRPSHRGRRAGGQGGRRAGAAVGCTHALDFLEPADAFIGHFDRVVHTPEPEHDLDAWEANGPTVLHLAAPTGEC